MFLALEQGLECLFLCGSLLVGLLVKSIGNMKEQITVIRFVHSLHYSSMVARLPGELLDDFNNTNYRWFGAGVDLQKAGRS